MSHNVSNRKMIRLNNVKIIIGTCIILTLLSLPIFIIVSVSRNVESVGKERDFIIEKQTSISGAALSIQDNLSHIANDLLILSEFVASNQTRRSREESRLNAEHMFYTMAEISEHYDQIRFIDASGMEQIRVNYNYGDCEIVSAEDLQNKGDRYYFTDSINLAKGQVYVSVLDLNIEHGEIEVPYKPMIRFATPVIGTEGELHGIVVLNYLAENTLNLFREMFPENVTAGTVMMLNAGGYYIVNDRNPDTEFGFMFPDHQEDTAQKDMGPLWQKILTNETGNVHLNDKLYVFSHIHPLGNGWVTGSDGKEIDANIHSSREYNWIILSEMPLSYFERPLMPATLMGRLLVLLSSLILIGVAILLSYYREVRRVDIHNIRVLARYDQLTGLDTREHGMDQLEILLKKKKKHDSDFSLLFLDLNKFKPLNDTYGHEAGDFCLAETGKRIRSVIREKDVGIRLGGDEFLIVLNVSKNSADLEEIANRIHSEITREMDFNGISISVGVSIGIACYPADGHTMDELISFADDAMYRAKKSESGIYPAQ